MCTELCPETTTRSQNQLFQYTVKEPSAESQEEEEKASKEQKKIKKKLEDPFVVFDGAIRLPIIAQTLLALSTLILI